MIVLRGRTVVGGRAEGEALVTQMTVPGWGGVNPVKGVITETRHDLRGVSFAGKVLVFRGAKGSSGWSAMYHTTRLAGTAPAALVFNEMTTKVALGRGGDAGAERHRARPRSADGDRNGRLGGRRWGLRNGGSEEEGSGLRLQAAQGRLKPAPTVKGFDSMRRTHIALFIAATATPAVAQTPAEIRDAVVKALAPVQKAQEPWYTANKQVCASCHHQYQPSLAFRAAREHGVPVNEAIARADAAKAFTFADIDKAIQYQYVIEPSVDDAYRMMAAHAAGVAPNLGAAIYARLLISRQNADGTWDGFHQRPPSSYSRFTMATLGLRAVQLYRHASQKAAADAAVARARGYLEKNAAPDTEGPRLSAARPEVGGCRRRAPAPARTRARGDAAGRRRLGVAHRAGQRRVLDRTGARGAARRRRAGRRPMPPIARAWPTC